MPKEAVVNFATERVKKEGNMSGGKGRKRFLQTALPGRIDIYPGSGV